MTIWVRDLASISPLDYLIVLGWVCAFSAIVMISSFIVIETYFWRRRQYIKWTLGQLNNKDICSGKANTAFRLPIKRPWHS